MIDMFPKDDLIATMHCELGSLLPCKLDWPVQKFCYWGGHPVDVRPAGGTRWQDPWGVTWNKESSDPGMMPFPVGHPMDGDWACVKHLNWPDPNDSQLFADLRHLRQKPNRVLIGEHPFAIYERAWLMAGMQNLLAAMAEQPRQVDELFARIGVFEVGIARQYVALGVEAAWIADDYGMSAGLMFSPAMWRRFVLPHLKGIVGCYHDAGVIVVLHSCGNITPLIGDFLDIGIDVLDPLQPNCNRLDLIRKQTAGRICLCGGVESSVLLAGDIRRTDTDTRERIRQLGGDGGYIVGPDDDADYPRETHEAMIQAVEDFRGLDRRDNVSQQPFH